MIKKGVKLGQQPDISVGLLHDRAAVSIRLQGAFTDKNGKVVASGDHCVEMKDGLMGSATLPVSDNSIKLTPTEEEAANFSIEATIGIDFHWQQKEQLTFTGSLRIIPSGQKVGEALTVINEVNLESYLASVICSEMSATSPPELSKAHAVVSRSWLLAQISNAGNVKTPVCEVSGGHANEIIRWYDREAHMDFDVCADDHCQRYQGQGRISNSRVLKAINQTFGEVLTFEEKVCDARYSKCCGGVTEDFRAAWRDEKVGYLVPVFDGDSPNLPSPPLTDESAMRAYFNNPPDCFCNCSDKEILDSILPTFDRSTGDFFRWQSRLDAVDGGKLASTKLGIDLGRLLAIEPVARGLSGRLTKLRLRGEKRTVLVGKELEIRRALSPSHLYSSGFVVDVEGNAQRPDAFILKGVGWGHGVGLCQIGAAVMACRGKDYREILAHYYPGTELSCAYK